MMMCTSWPKGGHVTFCEDVWAKPDAAGPATPPAPAGLAPAGWKVDGAEPHATASAPTPANAPTPVNKAPGGPRHMRHPPCHRLPRTAGTLPTVSSPATALAPSRVTGNDGKRL